MPTTERKRQTGKTGALKAQCCGQVFSYIMTGAFMLLQPQRDLNIDCNYVLYDNCNVEYIS
jgi:hypothetical protein